MSPRPVPASLLAVLLSAAIACPPPHAAASARVAGNVWTVDPDASSLTIVDAGRMITVYCDADTVIRHGSTDRTLADLHRGDRVVVTLAEETPDALIARLVAIAGAAPVLRHRPTPTPRMP
jgi:hypothetical protein